MILTVREAIALLDRTYGNALDEQLVITWWDSTDFEGKTDQSWNVAEDQLDICISHVNDIVGEFATEQEEEGDQ